ncbi:MAG: hypothetical protein M3O15_00310, partial [Acidobacteriota bacterium]|nr:hypothetical protein [Acidobacteriota bacterium]
RGTVTRRLVFAGAHVLSPALLSRIGPGPADIVRDLYRPLLAEPACHLGSLITARRWHDLGTPRRFLAAALDWVQRDGHTREVSPAARVADDAVIRRSDVGAGATVEAG